MNLTYKKISGVYKIENIRTGKLYIGSSVIIKQRFNDHKNNLRLNRHCNKHFQRAYNIDGWEAFVCSTIEECPIEMLVEREQYWIDQYDFNKDLYNDLPTAYSWLGKHHTEETKELVSKNSAWNNPEIVDNIREILSNKMYGEGNPMHGRKHSEETKQKIREMVILNKNTPVGVKKKTAQINPDTNEIIKIFDSLKEASYAMTGNNKGGRHISSCIRKTRKYNKETVYGYKWEFINE